MSGVHDLPRPKMWLRRSPESYDGGVVRSDDGGRTWHVQNTGMPQTAATHILRDPNGTLYVTGFGRGVFKSADGGEHWTLKNSGIEGAEPLAWRLARDAKGTLYLMVSRRSDDGSFANAADGALYRSTDAAERWTRVPLPSGVNGPNGLAIDPQDSGRLYLAAWCRSTPQGAQDGGIYLTTDAGAGWRRVLAEDLHIYDVTIDPHNPRVLYAAGSSLCLAVLRSRSHVEAHSYVRFHVGPSGDRRSARPGREPSLSRSEGASGTERRNSGPPSSFFLAYHVADEDRLSRESSGRNRRLEFEAGRPIVVAQAPLGLK
jgi:hypothetical protein